VRIAIVTISARIIGGVESYLDTVIPLLEAAEHEIAMLCDFDGPDGSPRISRSASVPVWLATADGAAHALDSLRQWRPDLIYTHGLSDTHIEARALEIAPAIAFAHDYRATCISVHKAFAFPTATPCARPLGAGCLGHFYPRRCGGLNPFAMLSDFRHAARRLELLRSLPAVLTASEYVRAECVRNGLTPAAVRCVGLPVIEREGSGAATPPTGAVSDKPLRLLFAGRMEPLKGGHILLEALPSVHSALSRPLILTFAGDGRSRVEWARRADALVRRHPAVRVDFTGWLTPAVLRSLFDSSDLLVVPSLWPEPFGLVGPEAGMRGLPAAAFATGGIPEWLTDGTNGALAREIPPTPADLADAIVRCLRDPVDHARLRRGAVELARRFRPERHLRRLADVFEQVASQAPVIGGAADRGVAPADFLSHN
jgi:glycosyltransferase involved in cell wall biosynthesis